ncbi:MAG: hypothetical protein LBT74_06800 [Acidobacteriota bacterium]|jgi:uroporphyrinogen decarboxylase|nr:hypothetical protein [Acidobacteriota bacterium]
MKKREFLKTGLYALGGAGVLAGCSPDTAKQAEPAGRADAPAIIHAGGKREKVLEVLDQSRPNKYVPAAFFMHFEEKLGKGAIDSHMAFFRATNMDFVKIQYEQMLDPIEGIDGPGDWSKIPVYREEDFEPQLAVIEALAKELKSEALIMPTVYPPTAFASMTVGMKYMEQVKQDPDATAKGFANLTESIVNFMRAALRRGADGFYVSTQGGEAKSFGDGPVFEKIIAANDKVIMQECADKALLSILHICDYWSSYTQIKKFVPYQGSVINPPNTLADGSPVKLKDVQAMFSRPVMGGLDRLGVIAKGTVEEIKPEIDRVMREAAQNFILGADCTVDGKTSWETLRAAIDYAHDWRSTH